jgi:hypothetical protein
MHTFQLMYIQHSCLWFLALCPTISHLLLYQEDPPTPRDRTIVTHKSPASPMYVRSFGGFATQQGVLGEAAKLKEAVQEDGHSVLTEWFYFASYDPPYRQVRTADPRPDPVQYDVVDRLATGPL